MYFCPNCNNIFDITKNPQEEKAKTKVGGASTDYALIIEKILKNQEVLPENVVNLNLNTLIKEVSYKKLKVKEKELVYNKMQELLPENKKLIKEMSDKKNDKAYFICKNCGFLKPINDGTLIFSRVSSDISQTYTSTDKASLKAMANSDILPRTRKYICKNSKCISHKDPTKREACFFRMNNSYKIKYICLACNN
jgi:DNA-directed RNA polymerase subunit M/transcription elongation factor TFIIS